MHPAFKYLGTLAGYLHETQAKHEFLSFIFNTNLKLYKALGHEASY